VARATEATLGSVEAIQREIAAGVAALDAAVPAAEQLTALAKSLAGQAAAGELAAARLQGLVALEQGLVRATADLQAADAALVRLTDLAGSLADASGTVGQLQRFVVDVMLLEPAIVRAVRALEPVAEFTRAGRRAAAKTASSKPGDAAPAAGEAAESSPRTVPEVARVLVEEHPEHGTSGTVGY
jgi:hypothetical protein